MNARLVAHWALTLIAAMTVDVCAPLPFTGPDAGTVGALAVIAVAAIGYATAPTITRKATRP